MEQANGKNNPDEERIVLDCEERLSECTIWSMLEEVYNGGAGRALWETVPFYPTSNAFIGEIYAGLVIAFLRDYHEQLNADEPVYVIELGSGSGCFSFYMLKELFRKLEHFSAIRSLKLKYIMTDMTPSTLADTRLDQSFSEFRENGRLSFALFRPEDENEFTTYGGTRIASDTVKNPIIVIANYFFDSLRQDAFRVFNGRLQEVLHTFYSKCRTQPHNFDLLKKVETYRNIAGDYYDDPVLDDILRFYHKRFTNASVIFPIGAFRCLDNLRSLSGDKLVLISTDRGFTREDYVTGLWPHRFHSEKYFFSYPVNYFAIRKYFENFGGISWATSGESLCVHTQLSAMLGKHDDLELEQTSYTFSETVERKNSIEFLFNCQELLTGGASATKDELAMAYAGLISLCNNDPIALCHGAGKILAHSEGLAPGTVTDILAMLARVEENFFRVTKRHDSLYWVGRLRYALAEYEGAISALERSIKIFGENEMTLFYLAASLEAKGRHKEALTLYRQCLKLEPGRNETAAAVKRLAETVGEPTPSPRP